VLWALAGTIQLQDVPLVSANFAGGSLAFAAVALFLFLFELFKGQVAPSAWTSGNEEESPGTIGQSHNRRIQLAVVGLLLVISFVLGIMATIGLISVAWGILLVLPLIVFGLGVALYYFAPWRAKTQPSVPAWQNKTRTRNWVAGVVAVTAAVIFFSVTYNGLAQAVKEPGMDVFNTAFLFYMTVIPLNFLIDPLLINVWPKKSLKVEWPQRFPLSRAYVTKLGKNTGFVFLWRLGSIAAFLAFVPVIFYSGIPISINILILIGLPVLAAAVYFLGGIVDWGTRSRTLSLIVITAIIATFLEYRIFRIF
jgi:hypothetical protein